MGPVGIHPAVRLPLRVRAGLQVPVPAERPATVEERVAVRRRARRAG